MALEPWNFGSAEKCREECQAGERRRLIWDHVNWLQLLLLLKQRPRIIMLTLLTEGSKGCRAEMTTVWKPLEHQKILEKG